MSDSPDPPASGDEAWNINTCPHCEGRFKSRADSEESEIACPHCGEIFDSGGLETTEVPSDGDESIVDELPPAEETPSKHKRRKPAKEYKLGWDTSPQEEADAAKAELDDDVAEFYTTDPNDPNAVRIKRVTRKKNLTPAQKFGRALVVGTVVIVVAATAIAITLLVKEQVEVVTSDVKEQSQLPEKVRELVEKALAAKNDSAVLTEDELAACTSIVNGFYNAKTLEEKLAFVRVPERVKPLIEASMVVSPEQVAYQIDEIVLSQKLVDKDRLFITIAASVTGKPDEHRLVAFEQKEDTILMDWEVSNGFQQIPVSEFIARRVSTPTVFRAKLTKSEYYAGAFEDKNRFQSVGLSYPGQPEFKLAGFVERNQPWADALLARLEFEAPSMIITLKFPDQSPSAFEVEITGVVLDSWFY